MNLNTIKFFFCYLNSSAIFWFIFVLLQAWRGVVLAGTVYFLVCPEQYWDLRLVCFSKDECINFIKCTELSVKTGSIFFTRYQ